MNESTLAAWIARAGQHPHWVLAAVAFVAFAESLAVVGTFVPAAVVLFGAGVLAGHGSPPLAAMLLVAIAGAVAGDGLSYEWGRRPHAGALAARAAGRRGELLARAEDLIRRRGATSVLIARFVAPLRAWVPVFAGLARMPRARFYPVNVASAALWAPVHILPGVVFGTSLRVAEAVSGRLALLFALLVAVLWITAWIVTRVRHFLGRHATALRVHAAGWLRGRDARWARMGLRVLDPTSEVSNALLAGMLLVLAAGWLFLGIVEDVLAQDPLVVADRSVFAFLQPLRTVAGDRVMVLVTEAGSVGVLLPLVLVVLAWLLWRRCWRTALLWVTSAAFAELLVQLLKFTLGRKRPLALYQGTEAFSFPSGHATVSAVVLGLLAFLVARRQSRAWRTGVALVASVYVVLVAFSRLYLGAHWFSDVVGGMSLGLAWVAIVATVVTARPVDEPVAPRALASLALACIVASTAAWHRWHGPVDARIYAARTQPLLVSDAAWQGGQWQQLPQRRREMAGDMEERFPLQWACSADEAVRVLAASGWQRAPAWDLASLLQVLADPSATTVPPLPRFDQGRHAGLTFVAAATSTQARQVLRLWRADVEVGEPTGARVPVWYGAVYLEQRGRGPLHRLHTTQEDATPLVQQWLTHGAVQVLPPAAGRPTLLACASGR